MAYKMENEELQIASCSIADLTVKQAQHFTEQWGDGASLGTLTLFYEKNTGLLVLNRDNNHFKKYKDIAEGYLSSNDEQRKELRNKEPESMQETLQVLESCIKCRLIEREIKRALNNTIDNIVEDTVLMEICKKYDSSVTVACIAFRYGVMQGKRAERARRKVKGGAVA